MRKCVLALARITCTVEYSMICYNKPIRFASAVTGTDYGFLATFDCTYQKSPGDEGNPKKIVNKEKKDATN